MTTVRLESASRPPEIDYTSSKTTVYLRSNFEQVEVGGELRWRYDEATYPKLAYLGEEVLNRIELNTDKAQIVADGVDEAIITAKLPSGVEYCFVTVNGEVAEKADIESSAVTRAFAAQTPGIYRIDFHAMNRIATAFIEVIENA